MEQMAVWLYNKGGINIERSCDAENLGKKLTLWKLLTAFWGPKSHDLTQVPFLQAMLHYVIKK